MSAGAQQNPDWWPSDEWSPTPGAGIVVWTAGAPNKAYRRSLEKAEVEPDGAAYPQGGLVAASEPFRQRPDGEVMVMVAWAVEWRSAQEAGRPALVQAYPVRLVMPDVGAPQIAEDHGDHDHHTESAPA